MKRIFDSFLPTVPLGPVPPGVRRIPPGKLRESSINF